MATQPKVVTTGKLVEASLQAGLQSLSVTLYSLRELGISAYAASAALKQMSLNSLNRENREYLASQLKKLGIEQFLKTRSIRKGRSRFIFK